MKNSEAIIATDLRDPPGPKVSDLTELEKWIKGSTTILCHHIIVYAGLLHVVPPGSKCDDSNVTPAVPSARLRLRNCLEMLFVQCSAPCV
jgi:hypothetical protein